MKASTKMKSAIALVIVAAFFVLANTAGFSNGIKKFFLFGFSPCAKKHVGSRRRCF
jgi:hypothetical protein